jgi:hypothetical protein
MRPSLAGFSLLRDPAMPPVVAVVLVMAALAFSLR